MTPARGTTLLEVVIALVLVAVGWLALLGLQTVAVRLAMDTEMREEARWALQALADSLDRHADDAGEARFAWGSVEWAPAEGGWVLRAVTAEGLTLAELWSGGRGGVP